MTAIKHKTQKNTSNYRNIQKIDGRHPLKDRAPFTYVEYQARIRKRGKVILFNFNLAKEIGLINSNHPEDLNLELEKTLMETFGLMIVNEWDIIHKKKVPLEEIKKHRYMATRYLQLQHPDNIGKQSGDGRSIWNGYFKGKGGITWDFSSCGTGATCLSPAAVHNKTFYKSGDPYISYGCGYANLSEGIVDYLSSEIFNSNGIKTERVLCVISYPGNFGIVVRASPNLLRPSHFFNHLRQGKLDRLKNIVDAFIDRELDNGTWPSIPQNRNRYDYMVEKMTETFAGISAQFESEYIFCWLDWDGDNILANGGIIDYGSVRQFGLYHHSYQFDDQTRWSTTLKQQKYKAKHIMMSIAQTADFIKTGLRKSHRSFKNHPSIRRFDTIFQVKKRILLMRKIGFDQEQIEILAKMNQKNLQLFEQAFYTFELSRTKRGFVRVPDGINWNAIFCMRDLLRELPKEYLKGHKPIDARSFINIIRSKYADRKSLKLTYRRKKQIDAFQKSYIQMLAYVAKKQGKTFDELLKEVSFRSEKINPSQRATGDAICFMSEVLLKHRSRLSQRDFYRLVQTFLSKQFQTPDQMPTRSSIGELSQKAEKIMKQLEAIQQSYRLTL